MAGLCTISENMKDEKDTYIQLSEIVKALTNESTKSNQIYSYKQMHPTL